MSCTGKKEPDSGLPGRGGRRKFIRAGLLGIGALYGLPAAGSRAAGAAQQRTIPPESLPGPQGNALGRPPAGTAAPGSLSGGLPADLSPEPSGWEQVPAILQRIRPPVFPPRDLEITRFGAMGDGRTDCRAAFEEAISLCNAAGGGRVVVPAGTWWVGGPIHLKSNIHLHLEEGALIRFDPDPDRYLPCVLTRWEGTELYNYSPLIYAYQAENVAITGSGTIDGNAKESFATWKPRQKKAQEALREMGVSGTPVHERVFGRGHWLRPSMIQFFGCDNILVEDITVLDAPFWVVHPVYCRNVTVRGLRVNSYNANNDGVDPDSSADVLIENCRFETGDDSIAIKSGRDQDGWRVGRPAMNVIVRNCDMNSRANGLCIGSEMSGGVRNVFMEQCRVGKVDSAIYFKANLDRGGVVENVFVRRIDVQEAGTLIHFSTDYHSYRGGGHPPLFRRFEIEDIHCRTAGRAVSAAGVEGTPLRDIRLANVVVEKAGETGEVRYAEHVVFENVLVNGKMLPSPAGAR